LTCITTLTGARSAPVSSGAGDEEEEEDVDEEEEEEEDAAAAVPAAAAASLARRCSSFSAVKTMGAGAELPSRSGAPSVPAATLSRWARRSKATRGGTTESPV
jgi:hypothetical protein